MVIVYIVSAFIVCMCFFFKQKTAYEMRISVWSSDLCSSDLGIPVRKTSRKLTAKWPLNITRIRIRDRKSVVLGKSVSVRVDLGGRRIIKTPTPQQHHTPRTTTHHHTHHPHTT